MLKLNPLTYKMKNPNGVKIIGSFYRKELLLLSKPLILEVKSKYY